MATRAYLFFVEVSNENAKRTFIPIDHLIWIRRTCMFGVLISHRCSKADQGTNAPSEIVDLPGTHSDEHDGLENTPPLDSVVGRFSSCTGQFYVQLSVSMQANKIARTVSV